MNRLEARIVIVLLLAGGFVLSGCGGGTAKSSSAKKHAVPRDLYIINAKTGAINQDFPDVDIEKGVVFPATSDGSGGWYIGGGFSRVGEVKRNGLARLRSDGSLDEEFAPRLPKMAAITAIVRHGKTVFVGGVLSGKLISGVAAFDAVSGRKLWQVTAGEISGVNSLAFADGVLFVGGAYKKIAGVRRSGLAALDPKTGKPTPWRAQLLWGDGTLGAAIGSMSVSNGNIYLEGSFGLVGGARRPLALAAVSARTGEVTSWNPRKSGSLPDHTTAILATHGQVLVGGMDGFVVYDAHTGRTVPWRKRVVGYPSIFSLSGNTVYMGARYNLTSAGGKPTHNLAAVVLPSGKATNWRPRVSPTPNVTALAVSGQNVLMAG
jgi:trimeric autotransporter adhesin